MSSNRGGRFSRGQGDSWGNPQGTRRRTQHRRISQLQGDVKPTARNLLPSEMVKPNKVFVPGMRLEGCGLGFEDITAYYQTGKGTLEDPMVVWLDDDARVGYQSRQAHNEIARSVARANKFQCVLIRKAMHDRECTYDKYGRRNSVCMPDGRIHNVTTQADNHMTVWMGEHMKRILVGGHIYVVRAIDPATRKPYPLPMDDPVNQRNKALLQPGRGLASEEFWLVKDTWERFS
ncbi:predicted protein [Chaetomium globosum CBS 148.51]|uniref:Uncharacterized protein n=1 Tax=Chaetomium globosum (strain ATCC 6205 / CBS 148.51 / DSM 1962 / NBRC 6347 / NRRL 1970) TaxID=306901 RepID=Q2H7H4_CHAGB|nr:uncharacterized protein CHGG_05391 [Chaetomium globosum CBS 148.51]EAQ88772.1 predicted protein [Chaetomium globosum CBS 148.51]